MAEVVTVRMSNTYRMAIDDMPDGLIGEERERWIASRARFLNQVLGAEGFLDSVSTGDDLAILGSETLTDEQMADLGY